MDFNLDSFITGVIKIFLSLSSTIYTSFPERFSDPNRTVLDRTILDRNILDIWLFNVLS